MAEDRQNYYSRIQQKHDFEINWNKAAGFYPRMGEIIVYSAEVDKEGNLLAEYDLLPEGRTKYYDYDRIKIGDGVRNIIELPFVNSNIIYTQDTDPSDTAPCPEGTIWIDTTP